MSGKIRYIKISRIDNSGKDITTSLESLENISLPISTGNKVFSILSRTREAEYFLFYVTHAGSDDIPEIDKSSLLYEFSGSFNGFVAPLNTMPPITSSEDNLGFFLPRGEANSLGSVNSEFFGIDCYRILTLPEKNIGVSVSSSLNFAVENAKNTTTSVTASVRILSNPLTVGLVPSSPTVLAKTVLTQSAQDLDNVYLYYTGSFEILTTISASQYSPGDCIYWDLDVEARDGATEVQVTFTNADFTNCEWEISSSAAVANPLAMAIEPYLTSPFYGSDCDVLQGEAVNAQQNPFLQTLNYSTSQTVPVNYSVVLANTATKATVPESYYTSLSQINGRYNGTKNQSSDFNVFNPQAGETDFGGPINTGTYGQTPPVDIKQTLVAYCDWIGGYKPELNNKVAAHIKYIINENGDAISPNLSPITVKDIQNNFMDGKQIDVSLIDPSVGSGMQVLNGVKNITKGGYRVEPILYSQIPNLPFSSSITMETSSLLPVTDVRNSSIRTTSQTATAGNVNTLICTTEFFDFVSSYNNTNGEYTVQAATVESGVDLILRTQLQLNPDSSSGGLMNVKILNTTTGQLIAQNNLTHFGSTTVYDFDLEGTVTNTDLVAGHVYEVVIDLTGFGPGDIPILSGATFNTSQIPSATTDSFLNITGSFWGYSASRLDVITGSQDLLNESYNFLKQEPIDGSGFNDPQFIFTVQLGDQFRFQDDESKVYNVIGVTPPDQEPEGKLKITLDREISSTIDKDYFLLRRYVADGSFIIFDENKPAGASGAAFIKPRFTTKALDKDIDQFIQELKSKNLLT